MLKLSAGVTAPSCWGLSGNDPWTAEMRYVNPSETAEKMITEAA